MNSDTRAWHLLWKFGSPLPICISLTALWPHLPILMQTCYVQLALASVDAKAHWQGLMRSSTFSLRA